MTRVPPTHAQRHWGDKDTPANTCFACRKRIVKGDYVLIEDIDGLVVWWHEACAPPEKLAEYEAEQR